MSQHAWRVVASGCALLIGAGCSGTGDRGAGAGLEIEVAPLSLPGLVDACYGLEVLNEAGQTVWSKAAICADQYGDNASSITYIGPCDASDPNVDGVARATVILRIEGLYAADDSLLPADADATPDVLTDWKNPCAPPYVTNGCRIETTCTENADTQVEFNLTIMREANQGFFDVAVNFDDIFCSAKVDCAYPATATTPARPIELVFDPVTGERVRTVVWAFACTDGDPGGATNAATHLYMDDVVLRCGAATYPVNPSLGPGNVYPGGVGAPDPLVQAMVFEGREQIRNGSADADKVYWNVALGLDASYFVAGAPTCVLETTATASKGPLVDGKTPPKTHYPFVKVSVPINSGAAVTCTQHPLDSEAPHGGVATDYTRPPAGGGAIVPKAFGYVGAPVGGDVVTSPVIVLVDECAAGPGPCGANASCTDLAAGFRCDCLPGFEGDPAAGCTDIDGCAGSPCYTVDACTDTPAPGTGFTCAPCPAGYEGDGVTCVDIDECAEGLHDCALPNPLCENTEGGFRCHATEVVAWGTGIAPKPTVAKIAIAAGGYHTVALQGDGIVVAWGYNSFGQTTVPPGLSGVVAVAAGGYHTVALKDDGTITAWGYNAYGQTTVPPGLSGVVAIAAGGYHTVALRDDGTITAWGYNAYGQTTVPPGLSGVMAVAAGLLHTVALKDDGTVVAWGRNDLGQTTVPVNLSGVVAVAAGSYHTVALQSDGTVVAWGHNGDGQTAVPASLSGVVAVAAGLYHTVALKDDGTVVAWGSGGDGQTTVPPGLSGVVAVTAGLYHTVALKDDGTVVAWGNNGAGQTTTPPDLGLSSVVAIAAGGAHAVGIEHDGAVVAWGESGYGQTMVPAGLNDVVAVAAGAYHTVALEDDGSVVAWGYNDDGQTTLPADLSGVVAVAAGAYHTVVLEDGGTVVAWGSDGSGQTTVPADLGGVAAVAAGVYHTVALQGDGTVVAWGHDSDGQVTVPADLGGVVAIAAGDYHTVALEDDGTVVAWGNNYYGQTTTPAELSGVVAVAAGQHHILALEDDGTVAAWGANYSGQATVPAGLADVIAIAAGGDQSYAIRRVTYHPAPTISGLSASFGVDGDEITVTGTHFDRVLAVRVAGHLVRWVVDSATQLRLVLPEVDATGPVEIVTVTGSATSATSITVDHVDACALAPCGANMYCEDLPAPAGPDADGRECMCMPGLTMNAGGSCVSALSGYAYIPAGTFTMGSPTSETGRGASETQHSVTLTRSFWMAPTEVTQGQWTTIYSNHPSYFVGWARPVDQVSWFSALDYANRLSVNAGLTPCYTLSGCTGDAGLGSLRDCSSVSFMGLACRGYRLPTESEWEWAARAGTTSARHAEPVGDVAWYEINSGTQTQNVSGKIANAWGLDDMLGNVWEWVWDWAGTYPGAATDPTGPDSGTYRIRRGGAYGSTADEARSAWRAGDVTPREQHKSGGFRLVRTIP